MEKYIKLNDAIRTIKDYFDYNTYIEEEEIIDELNKLSAITYDPTYWILSEISGETVWACAKCKYPVSYKWSEPKDKFCRNCGRPVTLNGVNK